MFADISRGKRIHYMIEGDGPLSASPTDKDMEKPVLFLVHGGPGIDHSGFKMHSLPLAKHAQLVLLDLTGHGKSSGKPDEHTLEAAIEDIEGLREYFKLKTIGVLGFSYGGMVALGYACKYSHNLSMLILICTAHSFHFIERSIKEFAMRSPTPHQAEIFKRLCDGTLAGREDFIEYFKQLGPLYSKVIAENIKTEGESSSTWDDAILGHEASNAAYAANFWHYDYTKLLPTISCPTLILAADDDWMCHADFSKEMAALIPGSTLHIFKDCGHILPIDKTGEYLDVVGSFIAAVSNKKPSIDNPTLEL